MNYTSIISIKAIIKEPIFALEFLNGLITLPYDKIIGTQKKNFINKKQIDKFESNKHLKSLIDSKKPFMAGRLGSAETYAMLTLHAYFRGYSKNINNDYIESLKSIAGFFGEKDTDNLNYFYNLYIKGLETCDFQISFRWRMENYFLRKFYKKPIYSNVLTPFEIKNSWLKSLEGLTVLVIHPFVDDIEAQYLKKELLFSHEVLPDFNLKTLEAVQSLAYNPTEYSSWGEALKSMERKIKDIDFDIALIGAGAYGYPLAYMIKKMNRQAVHIGGALQLLFGIKGKRWDYPNPVSKYFNEHWIRPSEKYRIRNYSNIEGGAYW
mgnify:CR=1 FL=1